MGCGVEKSEGVGFFNRFFGPTEDKLDVKNIDVIKEITDNSQSDSKATPSLLGRVTKGAIAVAKSLTSTQLLVMITLLSITALIIVLTFPVIKPFLVGVPVFVALGAFATSKGLAIFLVTKVLALLGLTLSGAGFGLKGLMGLFSHFSGKEKAEHPVNVQPQKSQTSAKAEEKPAVSRASVPEKPSWADEYAESDDNSIQIEVDSPELEKAWADVTGKPKPTQQSRMRGGVTPTPTSATKDPTEAEIWLTEYLSTHKEREENLRLEKVWAQSTQRNERPLSTSQERLIKVMDHLVPLKSRL